MPPFITALRARGVTAPSLNYGTTIPDGTLAKITDPAFFNTRYSIHTLATTVKRARDIPQQPHQLGHTQHIDPAIFTRFAMGARHRSGSHEARRPSQ